MVWPPCAITFLWYDLMVWPPYAIASLWYGLLMVWPPYGMASLWHPYGIAISWYGSLRLLKLMMNRNALGRNGHRRTAALSSKRPVSTPPIIFSVQPAIK